MHHQGTVDTYPRDGAGELLPFGPADETIIAHAAEIAEAVRSAPPGTRVRADARDDRTFLGIAVFSDADRTDEFEDVLPDDQVAYFWNPDPAATAQSIAAHVKEAFAPAEAPSGPGPP